MKARTQEAVLARDRRDMIDTELIERLGAIATVKKDEPLARHTTFGIGGPADAFVTVRSAPQLAEVAIAARRAGVSIFVLGSGSNILVGDLGIRGLVIDNQATATSAPEPYDDAFLVEAASGASFAAVARKLSRQGYAGIEWAGGIPGTLGGAVVYNAGAYGGCIADVLVSVDYIDEFASIHSLYAEEDEDEDELSVLKFGYRTSAFLTGEIPHAIVASLQIRVELGDPAELTARIAELDAQRLAAQPRGRNSGSTFKNPPGDHAWRLIDAAGMRGMRIGNARVSEKHSNFFENLGGARAADVAALMREAQRRVKDQFDIELQNEVEMVGEGFA